MEGENAPEEEILSVLDVPLGKMGRVIGRRGSHILSVKESCRYATPSIYFDVLIEQTYALLVPRY